jgi:hypothetical protein
MHTLAELQQSSLHSCGCHSSAQKIVRKYRKAHKRRLQKREYRNLQKIVPAVATKGKIDKVSLPCHSSKFLPSVKHCVLYLMYNLCFDMC